MAQAQALQVTDPSTPFLLTVSASTDGCRWGLWQNQEVRQVPTGFWSQLWKGAENHYLLLEKQLATVYAALLATEGIMGTQAVSLSVAVL